MPSIDSSYVEEAFRLILHGPYEILTSSKPKRFGSTDKSIQMQIALEEQEECGLR